MYKPISIFLSIFLSGFIFSVHGQSVELRGYIRDSIGQGIPFINVFVKKEGSTNVLDHTYSDDKGYYSLHIKEKGSFNLNFSGLSFKKVQIPVSIDSITVDKTITKDIVLKSAMFELGEVVVNANRDIIYKGDTVSINASAFMTGSEEVVEDILKKLPGISVGSDGGITAYGKSVEKVMVEGDDLFEQGYRILTQNLDSDVVNKVEILKRFSDNPILHGIEDSDKVALNLTIKKNRKNIFFGNLDLGYGTGKYYEGSINMMSFISKFKSWFLGSINNTGIENVDDTYRLIRPSPDMGQKYIGDNVYAYSLIDPVGGYTPFGKKRTDLNKLKLSAFSGIYNPIDKLKLQCTFIASSQETNFFRSSMQQYIFKGDGINLKNTEKYKLKKNMLYLDAKWYAVYEIDKDKERLEYSGKYSNSSGSQGSNKNFNKYEFTDNLNNKYWFTDQRLTYSNRIKNKYVFEITSRYIHDDKPQDYLVNQFLLKNIFPKAKDITSVRQYVDSKLDFFGTEGAFYHSHNENKLELRIGYLYKREKLNSDLFLINSKGIDYKQGDVYTNNLVNSIGDFYGKSKYKYILGSLVLKPSLEAHQRYNSLIDKDKNIKDNKFYLIPKLDLELHINQKNKLNFSYTYYTKNIFSNNLHSGFVIQNYNSFKKGIGDIEQLTGNNFSLGYTLGHISDDWSVYALLSYVSNNDYLSSKHIINSEFNKSTTVLLKDRKWYLSKISVDKFIESLSSNLKFKLGFSSIRSQNIINESDLRDIKSNNYNYGIELRSAFDGIFNFHTGAELRTSSFDLNNKNISSSSFLDLNFKISEKINLDIKNNFYYFNNSSKSNKYLFTDINAKWKISNSISLKLIANNLFNVNQFTNYYINDYSISSFSYRLIPRYFLIKFRFRF